MPANVISINVYFFRRDKHWRKMEGIEMCIKNVHICSEDQKRVSGRFPGVYLREYKGGKEKK